MGTLKRIYQIIGLDNIALFYAMISMWIIGYNTTITYQGKIVKTISITVEYGEVRR